MTLYVGYYIKIYERINIMTNLYLEVGQDDYPLKDTEFNALVKTFNPLVQVIFKI